MSWQEDFVKMSEEEKKLLLGSGRDWRDRLTEEERLEYNRKNSEAQIKAWAERDPNELAEYKKKVSENSKEMWALRGPEERHGVGDSISFAQKVRWAGVSVEERVAFGDKISKTKQNKSDEEKAHLSVVQSEAQLKFWEGKTLEERKAHGEKIREAHEEQTTEEQEICYENRSKGQLLRWENTSSEDREAWGKRFGDRIRKWHEDMTPEEKAAFCEANRERKIKFWASVTEEELEKWSLKCAEVWANIPLEEKAEFERKRQARAKELGRPSPNNEETILGIFLERHFQDEWKWVGSSSLWIGNHNPDFVHNNGRSLVIEYFGHPKYHPVEHEEEWVAHYKKFGYDCLVIWWYDLWEENVVEMVSKFMSPGGEHHGG